METRRLIGLVLLLAGVGALLLYGPEAIEVVRLFSEGAEAHEIPESRENTMVYSLVGILLIATGGFLVRKKNTGER